MQNLDRNSRSNNWLKKLISAFGVAGMSTLIGLPVLSQSQSYYPPMAFFQPLAYPNYPQRNEQGNLADNLQSNTNLKNLTAEIEAAGLTAKLKQEQFTLLAPTDEAFNALSDEEVDRLSEPENRLKILQYHLIQGEVMEESLNQGEVESLSGEAISISSKDGNLKFNDEVGVTGKPTVVNNGVIIEVDRVLLPPDL